MTTLLSSTPEVRAFEVYQRAMRNPWQQLWLMLSKRARAEQRRTLIKLHNRITRRWLAMQREIQEAE